MTAPAVRWAFATDLHPPDYEPLRRQVQMAKLVTPQAVPRDLITAAGDSVLAIVCRGLFDADPPTERARCRVEASGAIGHRNEVSIRVRWARTDT